MGTALLLALPLLAPAADPKPDFTATAEALAKESQANPGAFQKKYRGKVLEVTGAMQSILFPEHFIMHLDGDPGVPGKKVAVHVVCYLRKDQEDKARPLAKGQLVTIRGKQKDSSVPLLEDCVVVKAGPSTAVPITLSGLVAEWKADKEGTNKKYLKQPVVLRVKVLQAEKQGVTVIWEVTDPDVKGGPQGSATFDAGLDEAFLKGLQKVKAGDVAIILCHSPYASDRPGFQWSVILKEPPPGIKLPGGKK
jgi:hypothetical protein